MGNINKIYNFKDYDLKLSNSGYWDFNLSIDGFNTCLTATTTGCTIVNFDFNNIQYQPNNINTIESLVSWTGVTNTGYTLNYFGFTGIDNGYLTFVKNSGDTCNTALTQTLTGSTVIINSGDTALQLNMVTGMTGNYVYPIEYMTGGTSGDYLSFCGGFYQGFYKLEGYNYEVLPNRTEEGWTAEFWIRKSDLNCNVTGTTLNDSYPTNKGFFFYLGTRAENKFWNVFEGLNTGCTSGCCNVDSGCTGTVTTFCTAEKENEISFIDSDGRLVNLDPPNYYYDLITNPFLIYGRATGIGKCSSCGAPSGLGNQTACSYDGNGVIVSGLTTQNVVNPQNPFLIYGRASGVGTCSSCGAPSGLGNQTACSYSGDTEIVLELDKDLDIVDNALGFRITDDGKIGYRRLKFTGYCSGDTYVTGTTLEEFYSEESPIIDNTWHYVVLKYELPKYDECELKYGKLRKGSLKIFVDKKLKYFNCDFDEFLPRGLNDNKDKQLGVPYNMSLGGGTQGLIESMTFDGQDPDDLNLKIERNFAGTFIGDISKFKFNLCHFTISEMGENFNNDKIRYSK